MNPDYLRISVVDKCNLKCMYCHPFSEDDFIPHEEILRFEEIFRVVNILAGLGVRKIRLTGGEPLIKRGIETLVKMVKEVSGIEEVNMTTNGILLGEKYDGLKRAGLDRINISLNTLKEDRYKEFTGSGRLPDVLETIKRISRKKDTVLKINTILFAGINDDEIIDIVDFARDHNITVRFIEYFLTNGRMDMLESKRVSNRLVRNLIEEQFGKLKDASPLPDNGPARTFSLPGGRGAVGFISSHSGSFCHSCTRLRLSSDGKLMPCLFASSFLDVKELVRGHYPDEYISGEFSGLINDKCNHSKDTNAECDFSLRSIGG